MKAQCLTVSFTRLPTQLVEMWWHALELVKPQ